MSERLPFRATVGASSYPTVRVPATVLLHDIRSMYNVGSFFRTADGAGIERLLLSGITAAPPHAGIRKTALGAEEHVRWERADDALYTLREMVARGFEICAIETSERSVDIFDWQPNYPVCILFGHEVDGLPRELLECCDKHVRIPMLGVKHSLNVASAGAIVMYELLRKYRMFFRG